MYQASFFGDQRPPRAFSSSLYGFVLPLTQTKGDDIPFTVNSVPGIALTRSPELALLLGALRPVLWLVIPESALLLMLSVFPLALTLPSSHVPVLPEVLANRTGAVVLSEQGFSRKPVLHMAPSESSRFFLLSEGI